jgi:adenylate kinase
VLNAGLAELSLSLDHAIYLNVDRSELMRRVVNRRVSENSGAIYNLITNPPKVEGLCDLDGSPLVQRKDDTEEVFARRLEVYFKETVPVLEYYRERGLLREIDGSQPIDAITLEIARVLGLEEHVAA